MERIPEAAQMIPGLRVLPALPEGLSSVPKHLSLPTMSYNLPWH